jgi:hypothetical protein
MQLFQTRQYPLDGPIKTNGCDARFKCNITPKNYKYVTKQTSSQMCTLLCIQFNLFWNERVPPKKFRTNLFNCIMSWYPYPLHSYKMVKTHYRGAILGTFTTCMLCIFLYVYVAFNFGFHFWCLGSIFWFSQS